MIIFVVYVRCNYLHLMYLCWGWDYFILFFVSQRHNCNGLFLSVLATFTLLNKWLTLYLLPHDLTLHFRERCRQRKIEKWFTIGRDLFGERYDMIEHNNHINRWMIHLIKFCRLFNLINVITSKGTCGSW
jgi:hypothetical protein